MSQDVLVPSDPQDLSAMMERLEKFLYRYKKRETPDGKIPIPALDEEGVFKKIEKKIENKEYLHEKKFIFENPDIKNRFNPESIREFEPLSPELQEELEKMRATWSANKEARHRRAVQEAQEAERRAAEHAAWVAAGMPVARPVGVKPLKLKPKGRRA